MSSMTPLYSWFDDLNQYQKIFYYVICNVQLRTTFVCIEQVHVSFINHKDSCIIPYLHAHTYTNKPPNTHNKYPHPPPTRTRTHAQVVRANEHTPRLPPLDPRQLPLLACLASEDLFNVCSGPTQSFPQGVGDPFKSQKRQRGDPTRRIPQFSFRVLR